MTDTITIQRTTDYSLFRSISSNREVDMKHVRHLASAIRSNNLLHLNPIIVNQDLQIIDGQHRLEAAEQLGLAIFYVIDDNIAKADIALLNSNQKNWSVMDYVNYWTVEKAQGFDVLSRFIFTYPFIPPSSCLQLLSADGSRDTKALRQGGVNVANYGMAVKVAECAKWFQNFNVAFAFSRDFILSLRCLFANPYFDEDKLRRQVEKQPRSLVKCINLRQYTEMLLEIYNYQVHEQNRLKL